MAGSRPIRFRPGTIRWMSSRFVQPHGSINAEFRLQRPKSFTVPQDGDMPRLVVTAKAASDKRRAPNTDPRVNVVDALGKPMQKAQAMMHTANSGYSAWKEVRRSGCDWRTFTSKEVSTFDLIIRAEGYASLVQQIDSPQIQQMREGKYSAPMQRGQRVEPSFRLPPGTTLPKPPFLEAYFADFADRVQSMRQPSNRRPNRDHVPEIDFNMVNLREIGPAKFEAHLTEATPLFYVAIHAPGFVQNFEAGPFTLASFKNGLLDVPVRDLQLLMCISIRLPRQGRSTSLSRCFTCCLPAARGRFHLRGCDQYCPWNQR